MITDSAYSGTECVGHHHAQSPADDSPATGRRKHGAQQLLTDPLEQGQGRQSLLSANNPRWTNAFHM